MRIRWSRRFVTPRPARKTLACRPLRPACRLVARSAGPCSDVRSPSEHHATKPRPSPRVHLIRQAQAAAAHHPGAPAAASRRPGEIAPAPHTLNLDGASTTVADEQCRLLRDVLSPPAQVIIPTSVPAVPSPAEQHPAAEVSPPAAPASAPVSGAATNGEITITVPLHITVRLGEI